MPGCLGQLEGSQKFDSLALENNVAPTASYKTLFLHERLNGLTLKIAGQTV